MNKDNQSNAEKGSKNQFQPMTKTASRWSNEGRYYLLQAEKTQEQKHYKAARRCFVNAQDLEPDNPIHWYNGAFASYFLEDYEEALQATTRALELLPHNKQIRALHLEVDRIFNGSEDPTEQQEAETSAPAEQEEQVLDATEEKVPEKEEWEEQVPSATEEKVPEKEELPESPAKKKPKKKKGK